jgi:hypothetical protein
MILDRSLKYRTPYFEQKYMSHMIILERLAARGFFKNNRQVIVIYFWPSFSLLFRFILSMTNLEKLSLSECKLTLTDLRQLFRSCPKLTELHIKLVEGLKMEMDQFLKYELRLGFQRLRLLELHWDIESWPTIQGIFT